MTYASGSVKAELMCHHVHFFSEHPSARRLVWHQKAHLTVPHYFIIKSATIYVSAARAREQHPGGHMPADSSDENLDRRSETRPRDSREGQFWLQP